MHFPQGGVLGKFLVRVCRWDSDTLTLYQTTFSSILPPYSRLAAKNSYLRDCEVFQPIYPHSVFNGNDLPINKVAVFEFTFISEFF